MIAFDVQSYPLNNNEWSFPVVECVHIIGFAFSIGTVAIVDLRMLGLGMLRQTSSQLVKDTAPWTLWGLVVMLISGPLIFFSDPNMYLHNQSFRFKITALLLAILFNYTIHRKAALSDASGVWGKLVGGVSMALWLSVVAGGLFIAFV
jgi:hypothetical protein